MTRSARPRSRGLTAAALAALAAVALLAAACSSTLRDAARVGNTGISRSTFEGELRTLAGNERFVEFLGEQGVDVPESGGGIGRQVETFWLTKLIQQVIVDDEFADRDLEVTGAHREQARAQLESFFGGAEVFEAFPGDFRESLLERYGRLQALLADEGGGGEPPTEADARRFYRENRGQIAGCETGRNVAHILVRTRAEADDVLAELRGGAGFAEVAAERSIDTSNAANGGALGCLQPGAFVAPFEEAAQAAEFGTPTDPVETQFGWHVILVTPFEAPAFADVRDQIMQYLGQQSTQSSSDALNELLSERLRDADVEVEARYGEWVVDDQGARVEAPASPEVRDGREPEPAPEPESEPAPAP